METHDEALAVHAYETWGFRKLTKAVIDTLNLWAAFIYAPLLEDRPRRIQESGGSMYGANVAAKVHAELRRLGGVTPPREFVLMDRAAIGLGSVFLHLKAEMNWAPDLPRPRGGLRRRSAGSPPEGGTRPGRGAA